MEESLLEELNEKFDVLRNKMYRQLYKSERLRDQIGYFVENISKEEKKIRQRLKEDEFEGFDYCMSVLERLVEDSLDLFQYSGVTWCLLTEVEFPIITGPRDKQRIEWRELS